MRFEIRFTNITARYIKAVVAPLSIATPFASGFPTIFVTELQAELRRAATEVELDASIRLDRLSPMHRDAKLSIAVSAVVEDQDGLLSYWALRHPPGKPDFHHADAFALVLDEVRN